MLEQIINYIQDVSKKHILVNSTKYQSRININQQANNRYFQVVVEDDIFIEQTLQTNVMKMTLNLNVLGFPTKGKDVLKIQSEALQVGVEIIRYIDKDVTFQNRINIVDYSFMSLSEFTDDRCCGQRITIEMNIPNPLNLCDYERHFVDKEEVDTENVDREITLKPIRL